MLNLANIIDQVGKDKGIDKYILIEALETAMLKAAEKRFGPNKIIEAHYQEEMGEIELFVFKDVVEEVADPDTQIGFDAARELDPEVALGDSLGVKLDSKEFGRIDAQTAKQIIIQKVREAERNIVYNEYSSKRGEIVTGIVQRFEKGDIIVDLGRAEAVLPKKEQVRREGYRQGERIRGIILDVKVEAKGPQIGLSRTHPAFLMKLFQMEVPELYEGIVEIKGAAREPGDRAKIAVLSHNSDVDAVGACVGMKGSRVQAVVQELKGEKIDIVHWSDEPAIFVKNTLSPAQISRVVTDDAEHSMEVIVPDDQLSLAIGKKGQNVRLAAKLTGWKIDIRTESDSKSGKEKLSPEEALRKEVQAAGEREERERAAAAKEMEETLGISSEIAATLAAAGYEGSDGVMKATREKLQKIEGLDEEGIDSIMDAVAALAGKGNA
ncbi:MAG TPA: transcription termination/antitermination protein NusA [Deltaproteobacteria bacterium]|nr:MAG: transcription termination/antitermination protein NusA [Deltaproteobacteria bacterium GWA2_55_82]OIJ73275.1 MAG: transcription termination/antitermination protein NusA [Deltaproteobacteria bacterium GWC2_55_46]HBG45460.1 transcription termination/antitermination protein NusA [Deltaproteobacteria bacterium]HCY10291.1 transcription termination/antitermination protein NusA [Deltaproteobacteria bacterium]